MAASGSKGKSALPGCLTLSQVPTAGETAKAGADWAFVYGVSLVPPYLELMDK
jgi:hypothetical protein